jgi:hypothetical protein
MTVTQQTYGKLLHDLVLVLGNSWIFLEYTYLWEFCPRKQEKSAIKMISPFETQSLPILFSTKFKEGC